MGTDRILDRFGSDQGKRPANAGEDTTRAGSAASPTSDPSADTVKRRAPTNTALVGAAFVSMLESDAWYRFLIDMASLKCEDR